MSYWDTFVYEHEINEKVKKTKKKPKEQIKVNMPKPYKLSLVEQIKIMAQGKYPHYINVGEFERLALDNGFIASNARRRCQELRQKGILEKNPNPRGRATEYRWKEILEVLEQAK